MAHKRPSLSSHKGNAVKERAGFVVLRATLAARKPNCKLIMMGLVTQSPKGAEVRGLGEV